MKLTEYSQLKHGMRVRCKIYDEQIDDAKLSINKSGEVFICQDKRDGCPAEDRLGYKYSWTMTRKDNDFKYWVQSVENLESIDEEPSRKSEWQAKYYKDDMWFTKDAVFIYGEELTVEGLKEKVNAYRNILLAHNKKFPK